MHFDNGLCQCVFVGLVLGLGTKKKKEEKLANFISNLFKYRIPLLFLLRIYSILREERWYAERCNSPF